MWIKLCIVLWIDCGKLFFYGVFIKIKVYLYFFEKKYYPQKVLINMWIKVWKVDSVQ